MSIENPKIIIVGAGIAGLSLAALLIKHVDCHVTIVDKLLANDLSEKTQPADTQRVSAVNSLAMDIWRHLGIWSDLQEQASLYKHMQVWDFFGGEIVFDDASGLGCIVENQKIQTALYQHLEAHDYVDFILGVECLEIVQDDAVLLRHSEGELCADFLMGADGARSWVRDQLGIAMKSWDYGHTAIVANVTTEKPHQQTAWQKFTEHGPLAFLPLKDPHECSIVWSVTDEQHALLDYDDQQFAERLAGTFEYTLGKVTAVSPRKHFPLTMRHVEQYLEDRCMLIGDAAHTIHPLAGLGLNLAMQDVLALADVFIGVNAIPQHRQLRRFERARKAEVWKMVLGMEAIKRAFSVKTPILQTLVNFSVDQVAKHDVLTDCFSAIASGKNIKRPGWML